MSLSVNASAGNYKTASPAHEPNEYYEVCTECHEQIEECWRDLSEVSAMQPTLKWYQNEWAVIGLTVFAYGAGMAVGGLAK